MGVLLSFLPQVVQPLDLVQVGPAIPELVHVDVVASAELGLSEAVVVDDLMRFLASHGTGVHRQEDETDGDQLLHFDFSFVRVLEEFSS